MPGHPPLFNLSMNRCTNSKHKENRNKNQGLFTSGLVHWCHFSSFSVYVSVDVHRKCTQAPVRRPHVSCFVERPNYSFGIQQLKKVV